MTDNEEIKNEIDETGYAGDSDSVVFDGTINDYEAAGLYGEQSEIPEEDFYGDEEPELKGFQRFMKAKKPDKLYYVREALSYVLIFIIAVIAGLFINIYLIRLTRVNGTSMYPTLKGNQLLTASRLPVIFNDINRGDVVIFDHNGTKRTFSVDFKEALSDNAITALFTKSKSEENHTYYIKRVIGAKGDVIKIYEGSLYRTTLKNIGFEEYIGLHTEYCKNKSDVELYTKHQNMVLQISQLVPDETWELLDLESEPYVNPAEDPRYSEDENKCWIVGDREFFPMGDNRNHSTDGRRLGVQSIDCVIGKVLGNH